MCVPVVLAAVTASAFLGVAPVGATSNACRKAAAVNHQRKLAHLETPSIVANLVPVPGYCYVDISKGETEMIIAALENVERNVGIDDLFASASAHAVVAWDPHQNTAHAGSGKETGFLVLYAFTNAPPAGIDEQLATATSGLPVAKTLDIAGTWVFRLDDPRSEDSRYFYTWLRHGVQGVIDGADRAPLEKWLRRYLAEPVRVGSETSRLSSALVPVPGFAYVDFDLGSLAKDFVTVPLGKVPYNAHQIADAEGSTGGLVLAEAPEGVSTAQYVEGLQERGFGGDDAGQMVLGSTTVEHLTIDEGDAYVWVRDGIAGVFVAVDADRATPFLAALLA